MAENKMTRVAALEIALANVENAEAAEIITKMIAQLSKPRSKSSEKTPARIGNESAAHKLYDMCGDTVIDSAYVMEHTDAMTPQKVVGIMRVGIELGLFEKYKEGKRTVYKAIR